MGIGLILQNASRRSSLVRGGLGLIESTLFGSRLRRSAATLALRQFYSSAFRRKWLWQTEGEPHFTDHDYTFWRLYDGALGQGVYSLARGMHAAEHVNDGASALDIGCGDGGFTKRFLAPKAGHVDAIDLEPSAIETAQRRNPSSNISYRALDATAEPFPLPAYDLVVMDGVIGHISKQRSEVLLGKIRDALTPEGVFCGSETLGREGHDHLQFFETRDDLEKLLRCYFGKVSSRILSYRVGSLDRRECLWVCRA